MLVPLTAADSSCCGLSVLRRRRGWSLCRLSQHWALAVQGFWLANGVKQTSYDLDERAENWTCLWLVLSERQRDRSRHGARQRVWAILSSEECLESFINRWNLAGMDVLWSVHIFWSGSTQSMRDPKDSSIASQYDGTAVVSEHEDGNLQSKLVCTYFLSSPSTKCSLCVQDFCRCSKCAFW